MENIAVEIQDNILILRINLDQEMGLTKSERSICIGSSHGNQPVWIEGKPDPRSIRFNVSVFRPLNRKEKEARKKERGW